jgi:hypothetical protein
MGWYNGWAWFWMVPMMLFWVLALGAVVYTARIADRARTSINTAHAGDRLRAPTRAVRARQRASVFPPCSVIAFVYTNVPKRPPPGPRTLHRSDPLIEAKTPHLQGFSE